VVIGFLIRRATLARRRQEWLQSGQVGLAAAVMGDQHVGELGNGILEFLAKYVGAVAGAIFVTNGEVYRRTSTYGVPEQATIPEQFKFREGLLGQAAAEKRIMVFDEIPQEYLAYGSALAQGTPNHLMIAPAANDGHVNTVIELGFLRAIDEDVLALLKQASEPIAIAVRSANYRSELQNLLEETQRQAEELQSQSEELRVSNEELEEQGRALKESHARLEQQQVELEQTNSQLEEQTQQLELQRDDLERANASVQLKARELEQSSRYKSDFLANMSHELRTPLNSSLILAKLLADNSEGNLSEEQVKYAETIQSSGNDLLNLINDILDLSKIEAGHVEIRAEPLEIERLVKTVRQLFEPVAQQKNLEFFVQVAADCAASIETDGQRLEQVLKNLLSNAFKFTEDGRVSLSIRPARDGQIALSVADTGSASLRNSNRASLRRSTRRTARSAANSEEPASVFPYRGNLPACWADRSTSRVGRARAAPSLSRFRSLTIRRRSPRANLRRPLTSSPPRRSSSRVRRSPGGPKRSPMTATCRLTASGSCSSSRMTTRLPPFCATFLTK
jgi:signal transduction histidine kinase